MITRIALENWRAYRNLDLDIDPGTTFLVAPNGVGKSSLLEAVRWALGAGHVEQRPSMIRQGHTTAQVTVTLALPAGAWNGDQITFIECSFVSTESVGSAEHFKARSPSEIGRPYGRRRGSARRGRRGSRGRGELVHRQWSPSSPGSRRR